MIRLLLSLAEALEERAATEQALDPRRAQWAAGMREAAKILRSTATDNRRSADGP